MLKNLVIGLVAASTLGATAAMADSSSSTTSGFFVRGQLGYDWVSNSVGSQIYSVKSLTTFSTVPVIFNPFLSTNDKDSRGIAGRIAAGYNINQYLGVEAGFAKFTSVHSAYFGTQKLMYDSAVLATNFSSANIKSSLYVVDLLGKFTMPYNQFYGYVAGGPAYVHVNTDGTTLTAQSNFISPLFVGSDVTSLDVSSHSKGYVRPEAQLGVGYNITDNIGVDVSYTRIFGQHNIASKNYVPNINFASVGLTYKF